MESDLRLKLHFSLKSIAVIATAVHLWEIPDIQKKVQDHLKMQQTWEKMHKNRQVDANDRQKDYEWDQLKYDVFEKIESFKFLPSKVLDCLHDIVCVIQEKIYCWYEFVTFDLSLDVKFARKIYFTCQGMIDEDRIFQEFWVNEPNFCSSENNAFGFKTDLFTLACIFVQEDFIQKHLEEMMEITEAGVEVCDVKKIIKSYTKFEYPDGADDWLNIVPFGLKHKGLFKLSKFFMKQSTGNPKLQDFLVLLAQGCLINIADCEFNRYGNETQVNRFLYCFKEMSVENKIGFLETEFINYVAYALSQVWPYQTFLFQMLDFVAKTNPDSLDNCFSGILWMLLFVKKIRRDGYDPDIYRKVDDCMIMKIIDMMPRDLKRKTLLSDRYDFCKELFKACDDKILRLILNDRDMVDLRDEILSKGDKLFKNGATKFTADEMDNFLNRLGLTEAEKTKLKN